MGDLEYRLSQVELHGNRLQSLDHVIQCLRHCANLRSLAVAQAGADNPLCQTPGKPAVQFELWECLKGANRNLLKTDRLHAVNLFLTGYHKRLIENLPQLQILDGLDKDGRTAVVDEILADIPGLDQYLEYLVSSSSSVSLPLSLHNRH